MENSNNNSNGSNQQVNYSGVQMGQQGNFGQNQSNQPTNATTNANDQQILDGLNWEQKVGQQLYHGNDDPIDNSVIENQFNNRSIEKKIANGGVEAGYNIQNQPREIVAVRMEDGNLAAFKLDDGTILSKAEAIELTKQGGIKDCNVGRRGSKETLRRNPVEDASKALTNLPRF